MYALTRDLRHDAGEVYGETLARRLLVRVLSAEPPQVLEPDRLLSLIVEDDLVADHDALDAVLRFPLVRDEQHEIILGVPRGRETLRRERDVLQ